MTYITARYPQQMAWVTLLTAFLTLCLLLAGLAWAVQWVLYESTIDLRTTVKVSRGTVGYTAPGDTERVVRDRYPVRTGDALRTDELSQGHLTIADPLHDDQVLATLQILGGSYISLERASRPRFGLGDNPYSILITDAVGKIDVVISPNIERELRLEIQNQDGDYSVRLDQGGYYRLEFGLETLNVNVRNGKAVIVDKTNQAKLLETNQTGVFNNGQLERVESVVIDLIPNPLFNAGADETSIDWWGCDDYKDASELLVVGNNPKGIFERVFFQDRYALHIRRTGFEPQPRSTGCWKTFDIPGPLGIDVSNYDSLYIRATFYIVSHSISRCGAAGTECPIMLTMLFKNGLNLAEGTKSQWIQGFYAYSDPQKGGQVRCVNCASDHIHVNANSWYTFESQDFVLDIAPDQRANLRMMEWNNIEIYAAGHEYEVYISELALVGQDFPTQP